MKSSKILIDLIENQKIDYVDAQALSQAIGKDIFPIETIFIKTDGGSVWSGSVKELINWEYKNSRTPITAAYLTKEDWMSFSIPMGYDNVIAVRAYFQDEDIYPNELFSMRCKYRDLDPNDDMIEVKLDYEDGYAPEYGPILTPHKIMLTFELSVE